MTRFGLAALALAASVLLGGCFARYDMRATNSASQDVRISLHKGRRHREINTVVLVPGASAAWTGSDRRPILLRIRLDAGDSETLEIAVPRRIRTEFEVTSESGQLSVTSDQPTTMTSTGDGAPGSQQAEGLGAADEAPAPAPEAQPPAETPAAEEPAIDLVEPDGGS